MSLYCCCGLPAKSVLLLWVANKGDILILFFSQGMKFAILLLCTYGQTNVVVRLHQALTFVELINGICRKFDGLSPEMVLLFFAILGYNKFKVVCDQDVQDVQNMVSLANSFGLDHIDVLVQKWNVTDEVNCNAGGCMFKDESNIGGDKMFDVDDWANLLSSYCQHRSKTYLSAKWASGVTNVGQFFMDGANEFRTVLSKYIVECGF
ncbi:hypothetical protein ACSBR1_017707 [Camellia fascicularis]